MGISQFSEMERLAKVAKVNRAVVTNIGVSHIENLKTKENIRDQKLHIIDSFNKGDTLYLNGNDPLLSSLRGRLSVPVVFYGLEEFCDYRAKNIETHETFTSFILESKRYSGPVTIPAIGVHHVFNALAAIAVAFDIGLSIDQIQRGLLTYQTLAMRQQVHRLKRFTVIDDSYNASPDSIKSGLSVLKAVQRGKRSIAVLGDMLELGEQSQKEHFSMGEYLAKEKIDVVITVGEQAAQIVEGAKKKSKQIAAKSCASKEDAFDLLKKVVEEGDTILVKGSRGMHMDELVNKLFALGQ